MRKIVILSTPRCGTNLLMHSLMQHPQAVCAGEVCNAGAEPQHWGRSEDRSKTIQRCNLFKVLSIHRDHSDFQQFLGWGLQIYLYRQDVAAQRRSWVRAAETGMWMVEQEQPHVVPPPTEQQMDAEIAWADRWMMRQADVVSSYEQMVAEWDATTRTILDLAGWPRETLPMATQPTNSASRTPHTGTPEQAPTAAESTHRSSRW